jgi:hypothetical protein
LLPGPAAFIIDIVDIPFSRNNGSTGGIDVSIVRIGLAETKGFADGYDAIFGGKKKATAATEAEQPAPQPASAKKKTGKKAKKK